MITLIKDHWKTITIIGSIACTAFGFTFKKTIELHDMSADVQTLKKEMVEQKNTSQKIFEKLEQINISVVRTDEYIRQSEKEKDREAFNPKNR
jgi:hypothetical protein